MASEWPPARDSRFGMRIFRTGESELLSHVTDETLRALECSPDHLTLLRELEIGSVLTVAMRADNEIIGSLTFVGPRGGHEFDDRDRRLAEEVSAGAAVAIMGARAADGRARDRAEAAINSAERVSFMSSLSHGVRTPLHNIFGYAQLLEAGIRGPLNEAQRNDLGRIRENERHLLNLVDAVIRFARWDDDEPTVLEDVVVREALERADRDIVAAASRKGVTYDRDHAEVPAHLVVRAEFQRLTEILGQLLENAVKFSRAGDAVVVRAMAVGDCVWIRVSDTGIGIDDEDIELIFHPLVRGRDAYARAQDGVGLGLAITRKLARSMDGDLSVVSSRGKGSTFTISLPRGRQRLRQPVIREHMPP
jgi:signal transduction histidine kinase